MKLWSFIYHAKYEPEPSSGLAIISSFKNTQKIFDAESRNSATLILGNRLWSGFCWKKLLKLCVQCVYQDLTKWPRFLPNMTQFQTWPRFYVDLCSVKVSWRLDQNCAFYSLHKIWPSDLIFNPTSPSLKLPLDFTERNILKKVSSILDL